MNKKKNETKLRFVKMLFIRARAKTTKLHIILYCFTCLVQVSYHRKIYVWVQPGTSDGGDSKRLCEAVLTM